MRSQVRTRISTKITPFIIPGHADFCLSTEDTLNFWKGIADVGLLGEVVTNISTELLELLTGVQQRREAAALQDTGMKQD